MIPVYAQYEVLADMAAEPHASDDSRAIGIDQLQRFTWLYTYTRMEFFPILPFGTTITASGRVLWGKCIGVHMANSRYIKHTK